jgi:hypothetical protein
MSTANASRHDQPRGRALPDRPNRTNGRHEVGRLWAMTAAERVAAMWRGELTRYQLAKWTSRAPHEVPLLGNEFAWIAMRTPEWAEADRGHGYDDFPPNDERIQR